MGEALSGQSMTIWYSVGYNFIQNDILRMCTSLPKGLKKAKGARLKEFLQSTTQAIKCTYEQGMMVVSVRSFPKSTFCYPVP